MANVLIIDDDLSVCKMLSDIVNDMAHDVSCTSTLTEGMKKAHSDLFDIVFMDVWMPDGNGLEVLPRIRQSQSCPEIIVMTGSGDPDGAEIAIKSGAWDYIEKPLSRGKTALPLMRALQYRDEKKKHTPVTVIDEGAVIGQSPQIKSCLERMARAANSHASVLITGDTGTGKELFAQGIHNNSARRQKDFVVVDCAALTETLVESTLFGHEKGAFTGADKTQEGLVKQADGGTLFLDEVGELPLAVQGAFLRVLQERRFRPVGGQSEIKSDFRLVCATNRDLDQMVKASKFRQDLLFRLQSITIELPPLKARAGDITQLARYQMTKLCDRYGVTEKKFCPEFFAVLEAYSWPGNVRELISVLENLFITAGSAPVLFPKHLPPRIRIEVARAAIGKQKPPELESPKDRRPTPVFEKLKDYRTAAIEKAEKIYLQNLMRHTRRKIEQACDLSGLSRARMYALLKKYQISKFH
jgi:two-component system NtrC family response regulator